MNKYLVGRQPVFDSDLDVYGYELLFRDPVHTGVDATSMTTDVLVHSALDAGIVNLVGGKRVFINASRAYLVGELPVSLDPDHTVIEIPHRLVRDAEVFDGCRRLAAEGYLLAVDDYVWSEGDGPFLALMDIVKLDILALSERELDLQVERCSHFDVRLLSDKVETEQQLASCREMGFDLFQGYLLSRPTLVEGPTLTANNLTCLRLIEQLSEPDVAAQELAHIIETDPALSYRILRAASPASLTGDGDMTSVRDGVVRLGTRRLRNWITLILVADANEAPAEVLTITMARARMCELIASVDNPTLRDSAFTVGLLSGLELYLQRPLAKIVENLGIAHDLVDALLRRRGPLGRILENVLAWELGGSDLGTPAEVDFAQLESAYLESLCWATELCSALESGA